MKELEKEVQNRLVDHNARIPLKEKDADILYVPLSGALTIVPEAIIFNAVEESWTLSMFESANYAFFLSDSSKFKQIAGRIIKEAERLKVKKIVVTECGHAYTAMRWELPQLLGSSLHFHIMSILEVLNEYFQAGRLYLDPSKNPEPVTYHDPCNLGRKVVSLKNHASDKSCRIRFPGNVSK